MVDDLYGNLYSIEKLQRFEYKDRNGKDWGLNVRQRAKEVHGLIANSDRLKQERRKVAYSITFQPGSCNGMTLFPRYGVSSCEIGIFVLVASVLVTKEEAASAGL